MRVTTFSFNMQFCTFICLVGLFVTPFSQSLSIPQPLYNQGKDCQFGCTDNVESNDRILKYEPGYLYKYKVEGTTLLYIPTSVEGDISKLTYTGDVELSFENLCTGTLKLTNVHVFTADGKKYKDSKALDGLPVKFSWKDGKINPVICVDVEESPISTNIKRSIISNLQISSFDSNSDFEVDVFGQCPIDIEVTKDASSSYTIHKYKDLNKCRNREGLNFMIQTTSFYSNQDYQTNPFVKAFLKSVTNVEKGIIKKVDISEEYSYLPLNAYADSQTSVSVNTKISLVGRTQVSTPSVQGSPMKQTTLMYVTPSVKSGSSNVVTIIKALDDASVAATSYSSNVSPTSATEFKNFVNILRDASKGDILAAFVQVKSGAGLTDKQTASNCFWDGLIRAGTEQSVEAGLTLLNSNKFPLEKENAFLNSFAFVKHPTTSTLNAAAALLDHPPVKQQAYLGIGALVGRFNKNNPESINSPEFANIVNKLATPLSSGCVTNNIEEENLIIASLKGLGNVNALTDNVATKLAECLKNRLVSPRIRVAILEALKIDSLPPAVKNLVLSILRDFTEDSEIRIKAFHTYIQKPNKETAVQIKELLDNEQSTQVGGYIISFLKNLRNSMQPEKELYRGYFGDIRTKKRFPFDLRQHSQNYELSHIFSALNFGYSAEVDVIFSQKSYIPRSSSVNLNSYLFGNEINLVQVDARIENAEYVLEKNFGPRSYLQTNKAEDIADDISNNVFSAADKLSYKYLFLSKAKQASDDIQNVFKKKKTTSNTADTLNLDLSVKLSDQEVSWLNYHVDKQNIMNGNYLDMVYKRIEQAVESAKNMDIKYQKFFHMSLLGGNVISYPTSMGFPLTLDADINSVVNLQVKGKVNIPDIVKRPQKANVQLEVKPGAVIEVDGTLSIDAYVVKAGLKAVSSINTAIFFNIHFESLNGQGIEVQYNLPYDKQDIFAMRTEAFSVTHEKGLPANNVPLNPVGDRYTYNVQSELLANIFGVTVQAEVDVPALSLKPTIGPSKVALRYVKTDDTITGHYLKIFAAKDKNTGARSLQFLAKTLGREQKVSFLLQSFPKNQTISAELHLPMKQISMDAFITDNKEEYSYNVNLQSHSSKYEMKIGASITGDDYRKVYKPFLYIQSPVDTQREQALSDIRLAAKPQSYLPISIDGFVVVNKKNGEPQYVKYEFDSLSLLTPFNKFVLNGKIHKDTNELGSDLIFSYGEGKDVSIYQNSIYMKNPPPDEFVNENAVLSVVFSQFPNYGFKYTNNLRTLTNAYERTTVLVFGPDLNSETSRITSYEYLKFTKNPITNKYMLKSNGKVSFPLYKANAEWEVYVVENQYTASMLIEHDKSKVNGDIDIKFNTVNEGDIDIDIKVQSNSGNYDVTGKWYRKPTANVYGLEGKIVPNSGNPISLKSDVTFQWTHDNFTLQSSPVLTLSDNTEQKYEFLIQSDTRTCGLIIGVYPNNNKYFLWKSVFFNDKKERNGEIALFSKGNADNFVRYNFNNTAVIGHLQIHLVPLNRAILGKAEIKSVAENVYEGLIETNWDATKSKTSTVKINTRTELLDDGKIIKTRNTIKMLNDSYDLNGNLNTVGKHGNGDVLMDVELIFPNNTGKMGARIKYNIKNNDSLTNFDHNVELFYSKSSASYPAKLAFKFTGRSIDLSKLLFTLQTQAAYVTPKKKDISFMILVKRTVDDNVYNIGGQVSVGGALISVPVDLNVDSTYPRFIDSVHSEDNTIPCFTYNISTSAGSDYFFNSNGKMINQQFSNNIEIKYPNENAVKIVKWSCVKSISIKDNGMLVNTSNSLTWDDSKFANWNGVLDLSLHKGHVSTDWETYTVKKRQLDVSYSWKIPDFYKIKTGNIDVSMEMKYEGKKATCATKFVFDRLSGNLTINGYGPVSGPFNIVTHSQISSDYRHLSSDFSVDHKMGKWNGYGRLEINPIKPTIDLFYGSPDGDSKFFIQLQEKADNYWIVNIDTKWLYNGGGYHKVYIESKLLSANDLFVIIDVDSPKLNLNKLHLAANTVKSDNDKNILAFDVKEAENILANGNLTYNYQNEDKKLILEMVGQFQYNGKQYPIYVQYLKEKYVLGGGAEEGSTHKVVIDIDNKNHVINLETKFSNLIMLMKQEYCKGKQCFMSAITYQIKMHDGPDKYEKNLLIHIDPKPFVTDAEEVIISSKSIKSSFQYDYNVVFQWAPKKKIEYNLYINDKKSGAVLTFPKRQIAGEVAYMYNFAINKAEAKIRGILWLNKLNDEKNKLMLLYGTNYEVNSDKSVLSMKTSAGVQLPTMSKKIAFTTNLDLISSNQRLLDFKGDFDVFNTEEQAVMVSYKLVRGNSDDGILISEIINFVSKGQKLNVEMKRSGLLSWEKLLQQYSLVYADVNGVNQSSLIQMEMRLQSAVIEANLLNKINVRLGGTFDFGRDFIEFTEFLEVLKHSYSQRCKLTTEPKALISLEWKGIVNQKIDAIIALESSEYATIDINLVDEKNLSQSAFSSGISLGENDFLKESDTILNIDHLTYILNNSKKDALSLLASGKVAISAVNKELKQQAEFQESQFQKALIDRKMLDDVQNYFKTIKEELMSDESFKAVVEKLQQVIDDLAKVLILLLEEMSQSALEWFDMYFKLCASLIEFIKRTAPSLLNWVEKSYDQLAEMIRSMIDDGYNTMNKLIDYIRQYEVQWKDTIRSILHVIRELSKWIPTIMRQITEKYNKLIKKIEDISRDLPIMDYLRKKLQQLRNSQIPEKILAGILGGGNYIKDLMPTQELKNFLESILTVIDKILNEEPISYGYEFKTIGVQFLNSLRSLINLANKSLNNISWKNYIKIDSLPYTNMNYDSIRNVVIMLSNVWSATCNLVNSIHLPDMSSLEETMHTYKPSSINPMAWVPPYPRMSVIIDGKHIMSFNGRHYGVNGNCPYVLSTDIIDHNFTIVGDMKNDGLESITITVGKETMKILKDGMVVFNDVKSDYPAYGKNMYAVRNYHSINIYVDNSVQIMCSSDLNIVATYLSGFYYGKINGLLGSMNNEPYTDFMMPNGKVASSIPEFMNAYARGDKCAEKGIEITSDGMSTEECANMFSRNDMSKRGFSFVKPDQYREMCDHIVSSKATATEKLEAACQVSLAYSMVSYAKGYYIQPPSQCGKCIIGKNPMLLKSDVSVRLPQKKAEVVIVLEKAENNKQIYEEIILNLVPTLKKLLKEKGIEEVNFVLIGYGSTDKVPSIYTTNGKITFDSGTNVSLSKSPLKDHTSLGKLVLAIKYANGNTDTISALNEVSRYTFTPDAVKTVIMAKAKPDQRPFFDKFDIFNMINGMLPASRLVQQGIPLIQMSPMSSSVTVYSQPDLAIFGFDNDHLYSVNGETNFSQNVYSNSNMFKIYESTMLLSTSIDGAVFDTNVYTCNSKEPRSKLADTFTNRVIQSLTKHQRILDCTCDYQYGFYAEPYCTVVEKKLI